MEVGGADPGSVMGIRRPIHIWDNLEAPEFICVNWQMSSSALGLWWAELGILHAARDNILNRVTIFRILSDISSTSPQIQLYVDKYGDPQRPLLGILSIRSLPRA